MNDKYSGQCLCGEINYSADAAPVFSGNCHCKDCQGSSGGAYIPAIVFHESDVVVSGNAKYFDVQIDNGNAHERGFCPTCGSQVFSRFSNMPGMLAIKAGTLNDSSKYSPMLDFYIRSAAPWGRRPPRFPVQAVRIDRDGLVAKRPAVLASLDAMPAYVSVQMLQCIL